MDNGQLLSNVLDRSTQWSIRILCDYWDEAVLKGVCLLLTNSITCSGPALPHRACAEKFSAYAFTSQLVAHSISAVMPTHPKLPTPFVPPPEVW
jgi:hypothetical protein